MSLYSYFKKQDFPFIDTIYRTYQLSDEPKLFQYTATIKVEETDGFVSKQIRATGASFESEKEAYIKCVAEAIERYASMKYHNEDFVWASYNELNVEALDPLLVTGMSPEQQKKYPEYGVTRDTKINWTEAKDYRTGLTTLVPASLVYFNYKLLPNENYFYQPISTGAAGHTTVKQAIKEGIYEVAERDAFTLAYFSKYQAPKIDWESTTSDVKEILAMVDRYRLEIHAVDLTNDTKIPVMGSILLDKTGTGPGLLFGLGSDPNPTKALISSMQEAIRARSWIRLAKVKRPDPIVELVAAEDRGLYWYSSEMVKHLDFWIKSPKTKKITNRKRKLNLKKSIPHIYWKNISVEGVDYPIVKVIIPQLNPHVLEESRIPMGGKRFQQYMRGKEINKIPNPFI